MRRESSLKMSRYVTQYGHTLTLRQGWDDVYPKPKVSKRIYVCALHMYGSCRHARQFQIGSDKTTLFVKRHPRKWYMELSLRVLTPSKQTGIILGVEEMEIDLRVSTPCKQTRHPPL